MTKPLPTLSRPTDRIFVAVDRKIIGCVMRPIEGRFLALNGKQYDWQQIGMVDPETNILHALVGVFSDGDGSEFGELHPADPRFMGQTVPEMKVWPK